MIRAVNTAAGLMDYYIIYHLSQSLSLLSKACLYLPESGLHVEVAYLKTMNKESIEGKLWCTLKH